MSIDRLDSLHRVEDIASYVRNSANLTVLMEMLDALEQDLLDEVYV